MADIDTDMGNTIKDIIINVLGVSPHGHGGAGYPVVPSGKGVPSSQKGGHKVDKKRYFPKCMDMDAGHPQEADHLLSLTRGIGVDNLLEAYHESCQGAFKFFR
jgi:hypothetical protein